MCGYLDISRGKVEMPLTDLTLEHFCACPYPGPRYAYLLLTFSSLKCLEV